MPTPKDVQTLLEEGQLRSDALPLAHEHPICHQRREAADRVCQHCGVLSKGNERGFFCCCGVSAPRAPRAPHSTALVAQPPPHARRPATSLCALRAR